MPVHYFTLKALAREMNPLLQGADVLEAFSQRKNELTITFGAPSGGTSSLVASVDPEFNYCILRNGASRAKRNSVDLFSEIIGTKVRRLEVQSYDRMLRLYFTNRRTMIVQLYESAASNIFLLDDEGTVHESFKRQEAFVGTRLSNREDRFSDRLLDDPGYLTESLLREPAAKVLTALKHAVPFLGTVYAREVLHRCSVDERSAARLLTLPQSIALQNQLHNLLHEFDSPRPRIYFRDRHPEILSMIPLQSCADEFTAQEFARVDDAVSAFVRGAYRYEDTEGMKQELLEKLRKELHRSGRSLNAAREQYEHAARAEEYKRFGNLIVANLPAISKGMKEIIVEDLIASERRVVIALDPALSPFGNAERYFEKAKKARAARRESEHRVGELTERTGLLETLVNALNRAETAGDVKEFVRLHRQSLIGLKLMSEKPNQPTPPFRVFAVAGGLEVWVGKNSANNDLLTTKYAKPHDLWFHVRGAGGSHTVLRLAGTTPPPKEAIRQAASIAAYYSKMRNAGTVPVAYCERKYVRKPKGAHEGAVTIEREEVVFVKPKLP